MKYFYLENSQTHPVSFGEEILNAEPTDLHYETNYNILLYFQRNFNTELIPFFKYGRFYGTKQLF